MNFIIIQPDPIVRMDIEGMLVTQYPQCRVDAGASLQDIGSAIYGAGPETTLIVKGALVSGSADLRLVLKTAVTRGSRIVITGDCDPVDFPARFVQVPFTNDILSSAVRDQPDPSP